MSFSNALLPVSPASAYCRTTTCTDRTAAASGCSAEPAVVDACETAGFALYWPKHCFTYSINASGSRRWAINADQLEAVVRWSFDTWLGVQCPAGEHPNLAVTATPRVLCDRPEFNVGAPNQNIWTFRDEIWSHPAQMQEKIALTTVSTDLRTGEILDADVELNSATYAFTVQGDPDSEDDKTHRLDLFTVVLHEAGHVLGLADLPVGSDSVMAYDPQTLQYTLSSDDVSAICELFPPSVDSQRCDPTPRSGFTTQCEAAPDSGCSLVRPASRNVRHSWLIVLGCLCFVASCRRMLRVLPRRRRHAGMGRSRYGLSRESTAPYTQFVAVQHDTDRGD